MQTIKVEKSDVVGHINNSYLSRRANGVTTTEKKTEAAKAEGKELWVKSEMELAETKAAKKNLFPKPHLSYIALISRAIQSNPNKRMLLSDIYEWIVNNYPSFKMANRSWRNSVRHNLSLNECFIKCGRCDSGKGHYWGIHAANRDDFAKGDYRRRHARRLVKKCDELAQFFADETNGCDSRNCCDTLTSQHGYAVMTCTTVSSSYLTEHFGASVLSTVGRRRKRVSGDSADTK